MRRRFPGTLRGGLGLFFGLMLLLILPGPVRGQGADLGGEAGSVERIVARVRDAREALLRHHAGGPAPLFLSAWDFDGTIIKGDCSEGFTENGRQVYPGLAELGIRGGFSPLYSKAGGFERFWADYTLMDEHAGHFLAYPYLAQIFKGSREADLLALSARHFEGVLRHHYFRSSVAIWEAFRALGIESHVITGSPDFFVKSAAPSLGIPVSQVHGVRLQLKDGVLTDRILYPVTFGDGKREELQEIIAAVAQSNPGRAVYVLAAFGNSFGSDGPFIRYTVEQALPAGKATGGMINGGKPPSSYAGVFNEVSFDLTIE